MKIQKVEIQAFRAYDKVENGTFDFSTKSNEVADFISIYAPNGFGKTSFYDAVEWAYTNRISRFDRKDKFNKALAKSERDIQTQGSGRPRQWIIRNKFSELEEGFVRLYTTSREEPFTNTVPVVGKGSSDYKFGTQKRTDKKEYFHEVLLSQDFIDAFLKEDDPHSRYEKFIQSFGDIDLDKKYKTVVDLIKINDDKIKDITDQLKGIQLILKLDFDNELLSKINLSIEEFNAKGENLPKVDAHFGEKEVLGLANLIAERKNDLKAEIDSLKQKENKVDQAVSGRANEQLGTESYFETKEQLADLNSQLEKLRAQKDLLKKHEQTRIQLLNLEKELEERLEEDKNLAELIRAFPTFAWLRKKITEEESQIDNNKYEINKLKTVLNDILRNRGDLNARKNTQQTDYQKLSDRLNQLPEVLQKLSGLNNELKATADSKDKRVEELEKMKDSISKKESDILAFSAFKKNMEDDILPTKNHEYYKEYGELIEALIAVKDELKEVQANLEKAQGRFAETDSMNQELKELIEQGASIVNRNQSSSCPLCQQQYQSFTVLAERISNNPLLGKQISELLEEKGRLEVGQNRLLKLIEERKGELVSSIDNELEKRRASLKTLTEHRDSISRSLSELNERLHLLNSQISESLQILGLSDHPSEDFEAKLRQEIAEVKSALDKVLKSLGKSSVAEKKFEEKIQVLQDRIKRSEEKIQDFKNEPTYPRFISFQKDRLMDDLPSQQNLDDSKEALRLKIERIRNQLTEFKTTLEGLDEKLKGIVRDEVEKYISESESIRENLRTKILSFENLLKSFLDISLSGSSGEELLKTLENEKKEILATIKLADEKIIDLTKIDAYRENVVPFLKYQVSLNKSSELEAEKKFLTKVVSKQLEEERNRISEFIHQQVESFFYQGLINSLYQKIDPHPSYKEISFKCDFSTKKPMLNIFVSDDTQNTIVPTLYFSTAQLNILSLSIFLAKALNVKNEKGEPVDCIFIDDPIQSMDSINILSTIDLFRSIVVNLGKQIILSTHDENFQNLLKKKIPADLFPAKYLELETFGRVKAPKDHGSPGKQLAGA
ncbi:AAA family ATPase [Roseivirga sp. BDSF3-8]|uniref:AAA family ATPase n=1 Tax=Roseivirga sp. BDSF3-8 TaxID=3241598 RepID=UPI003531FC06